MQLQHPQFFVVYFLYVVRVNVYAASYAVRHFEVLSVTVNFYSRTEIIFAFYG
jgi:hypothetical protein